MVNLFTFCHPPVNWIYLPETSRWYAKDLECPREWKKWLDTTTPIPRSLCPHGPTDLMQNLPESVSVFSLFSWAISSSLTEPCRDSDVLPRYRRYIHAMPQRSLRLFWTQSYVLY